MTEEVMNAEQEVQVEAPAAPATVEQTPVETPTEPSEGAKTPEVTTEDQKTVPYDRFSKVNSEKNELKPKAEAAQKFEENMGMSIEDFLASKQTDSQMAELKNNEAKDASPEAKDFFDKYGKTLEEIIQMKSELETSKGLASLPEEVRTPEFEPKMMAYLNENPDLALSNEGLRTAYLAVKGLEALEATNKQTNDKQLKTETQEIEKEVAFVESKKESGTVEIKTDMEKILNLSQEEYSKLPQDVREKILQQLG